MDNEKIGMMLELEKRGALPSDKLDILSEARRRGLVPESRPIEPTTIPRTTGQKIASAVAPYARPVLEYGGMLGGGALATPGTVGLGTVAGAGLGYAVGRQAANALEEYAGDRKPATIGQAATQAAYDIPSGMAQEMGGQLLSKAGSALLPYAEKGARSLYQSALKPKPSLSTEEVGKRVTTGLKENIPVSKGGLEKSKATIGNINNEVSETIKAIKGQPISVSEALKPVKNFYDEIPSKTITPKAEQRIVKRYIDEVEKNSSGYLDAPQAQKFKQTLNKELNEYYEALAKGHVPTDSKILSKTKEQMANGLRNELSNIFPQLNNLNAREAALLQLNKSLNNTVNKLSNRDIIPLATQIAMGELKWAAKTLAVRVIDRPYVKSKLAFALYKANMAAPIAAGRTGISMGMSESPEQSMSHGEKMLSSINPVGTAHAGSLTDYAKGVTNKTESQLRELDRPQEAKQVKQPVAEEKSYTPNNYRAVGPMGTPVQVQIRDNGDWRVYSEDRGWLVIPPSERNKYRIIQ